MFTDSLFLASKKNSQKVILLHDLSSDPKFPELPPALAALADVWKQIAIPLVESYALECWERVAMKLKKLEEMKHVLNDTL